MERINFILIHDALFCSRINFMRLAHKFYTLSISKVNLN